MALVALAIAVVAATDPISWFALRMLNCTSEADVRATISDIHADGSFPVVRFWMDGECPAEWLALPAVEQIQFDGPGTIVGGPITQRVPGACQSIWFNNFVFDGANTSHWLIGPEAQIPNITIRNSRFTRWLGPVLVYAAPGSNTSLWMNHITIDNCGIGTKLF